MEQRRKKKQSKNKKEDRISTLPDALLHHIFSFLDTSQVVQTCVLSKRWRNLWTSHPHLNFNYETFSSREGYEDGLTTFLDFISHVLTRRDGSNIVNLRFDSGIDEVSASFVESLMCYAAKHLVREIYIDTYIIPLMPIVFPHCLSNCESLRCLELTSLGNGIELPKSLGLPYLKKLHLEYPINFDGKILSGCPCLEILEIVDVIWQDGEIFNIHALNLKRLEILSSEEFCMKERPPKLIIYAPKLTSFKFRGDPPSMCSAENLTSIEDVDVGLPYYTVPGDLEQEFCLNLIKMLNEFHNAKSMTLCRKCIEVLSLVPALLDEHPSGFTDLKYLKLKSVHKDVVVPLNILTYFLKGSSILKVCW